MWQTAPDGGMHPGAGAGPAVGYGGPPMGAVGAPLNGSPNLTEIGRAYSEALKLLTNQAEKPVYNMLSMLAGEQKRSVEGASVIADVLFRKLVHEKAGLPFLWLVDSIIKNERGLFPKLFESRIAQMFLTLYKADSHRRPKILHVRRSWDRIFTPETLQTIDAEVAKINAHQTKVESRALRKAAAAANDPRHALAAAEAELTSNRLDPRRRKELVDTVNELKRQQQGHRHQPMPGHGPGSGVVSSGWGGAMGHGGGGAGAQGQWGGGYGGGPPVHDGGAAYASVDPRRQHHPAHPPPGRDGFGHPPTQGGWRGPPPQQHRGHPPGYHPPGGHHPGNYHGMGGPGISGPAFSGAPSHAPHASSHAGGSFALPNSPGVLDAIINSIIPDGVLAAGAGGGPARPGMTPGRSGGPDLDQPDSLTVRFDSVIASLYDALPLQDQNSGVRFPPGGEKDLADHKDWLFRKREKSKSAGLGRGWFVDTETWVLLTDSKTEEEKKKASAFEIEKVDPKDDPELVLQESVLCTDDNKDARCNCGCNEPLTVYHDDDAEEWRYKSAVLRNGKLFHARHWLDIQKSGDLPSPLLQPGSPLHLAIGSSAAIPGLGPGITGAAENVANSVEDDEAGGGAAAEMDAEMDDGARTPPGEPQTQAPAAVATAASESGHAMKKQRI